MTWRGIATLRLVGTLGEPDFDPETGNRERFGSVWCIDESLSFVYDALVYDPASQSLSGDFPVLISRERPEPRPTPRSRPNPRFRRRQGKLTGLLCATLNG
jgi:hypothetical protein